MTQTKPVDKEHASRQRVVLLATDSSHSIIGEVADGQANAIAYSAYGEQSAKQEVATRMGFNGQLREANIGWYLLGNGYRAYNPRLMRFHSPDSWSPFGGGGLNAYMYCIGDPVNRSDPTGHWGTLAFLSSTQGLGIVGLFTSSFGIGLNIGVLLVNRGRATLAATLGTISGLTGVAAGLSSISGISPQASQLFSSTSLITGAASTYLGYRSIRTASRHVGWYEAPFSRPTGSPPYYFDVSPPRGVPNVATSSPPAYPLNRSTLLPAPAGEKPPAYSRQDPNLFSTPVLEAENPEMLSQFPEPIGVYGTSPAARLTQLRRAVLDRVDGLPTAETIRQRR